MRYYQEKKKYHMHLRRDFLGHTLSLSEDDTFVYFLHFEKNKKQIISIIISHAYTFLLQVCHNSNRLSRKNQNYNFTHVKYIYFLMFDINKFFLYSLKLFFIFVYALISFFFFYLFFVCFLLSF